MTYKPRKIDPNELNSAIDQRKSEATTNNFIKIKNGKHFIHVFPAWKESESSLPHYAVQIHFMIDAEGKFRSYRCAKPAEGFCVLCKSAQAFMASGNEEKKKQGQGMKAKKQFLYNVITTLNNEQGIMACGPKLHDEIQRELNRDLAFGKDPCSYKDGLKIKVVRSGSGLDTEYEAMGEPERYECKDLESQYEYLPQLDKTYDEYTNEQLTKVLEGDTDVVPSSGSRDVKDTKKFSKPATGSTKLGSSLAEPVEVSDEDSEEVEEVVTQSKKTKGSKPSLEEARKALGLD